MKEKHVGGGPACKPALRKLRMAVPWLLLLFGGVGFAVHVGFGTLSDFGWNQISVLCPLGALGTMLASKLFVPHALISLAIVGVLVVLLGRTFCGWACPVPAVSRLRYAFSRKRRDATALRKPNDALTEEELALLRRSCEHRLGEVRSQVDSRHFVLGGALVSAAVFGFPVFCLICPIGLSFATVLLLMRAFGMGDVTASLVIVPALLLVEVVFFRKWCHALCPLGALMSLIAKANRTARPRIDDARCLETSHGRDCGVCGRVCAEGIDPRHPALGYVQMNECTRCRKCVDSCPAGAISIPFVPRASGSSAPDGEGLSRRSTSMRDDG